MTAKIIEIVEETRDIRSLRLKPEKEMKYIAGQWMYVQLTPELKHHFTISSSPTEDFLQITTMLREESEYKRALEKLKAGDEVEVNGPFGSFVLNEKDTSPRLFIAGGIGITPFRSMTKYVKDKNLDLPIILLYSVKSKEMGAFVRELAEAKIIESEKEGRLDEEKVKKYCPDFAQRTWWVCGPPAMVETFVELGQKMGVSPENIKSEEFTGY